MVGEAAAQQEASEASRGGRRPAGDARCAHELFETRAARAPDAVAVVDEGKEITYGALNRRANQIARRLRALGVGPEARVGVCLPRSIEAIACMLAVLKAGGAYLPLDPALPSRRLALLVTDAAPAVILGRARLGPALPAGAAELFCCLDAESTRVAAEDAADLPRAVSGGNLAYVIYTSGSSGAPKGVLVEHHGLSNLARVLPEALQVDPGSRVLQFASLGFDASLFEVFMALPAGAALHLATGDARVPGPELLRLLQDRRVTHVAMLPSALAALPPGDLPDLRVVVCGGERLSAELVARFRPGRRVFNTYGPTEATISATLFECGEAPAPPPIGRALPGVRVLLLDAGGAPVAAPCAGEIAVGGAGVARGYLRRPALTAARFVPDPLDASARLYLTGDLGRIREGGEIEFLGRNDDQGKVRGFRVEPGEIEAALAEHPQVREVAASIWEPSPGDRRLAAYVAPVPGTAPRAPDLRRFLEERLPSYLVPATFVALGALPRLASGKVDRRALPPPGTARPALAAPCVPPRTPAERLIARVWSEILGVAPVGAEDDFFELGGDSLSAARAIAWIRSEVGAASLRDLFEARTVAALAARLDAAAASLGGPPSERVPALPGRVAAPLSFAQQRIWLVQQLDPGSAAFNLPAVVEMRGPLDVAALEKSLTEILRRHEVLRASIEVSGGAPRQRFEPAVALALGSLDLAALPEEERAAALDAAATEDAARPFALDRAPLVQARLVRLGADAHALILVLHHLVCDGWSMGVLLRELAALYASAAAGAPPALPPLAVQYGDYAAWQRERLDGEALHADLAFWEEELAGAPQRLHLPLDRPRPALPSARGAQQPLALPPGAAGALKAVCAAEGATLFMALLAGFAVLLHAEGGADDMLIGTAAAGRDRRELEGLIGHFASTLALRVSLGGDPSFRELIRRVRDRALAAYAHAALPFERLVEALRPARDPAYHPLFQVSITLNPSPPPVSAGGIALRLRQRLADAAPVDLCLDLWERAEGAEGPAVDGAMLYRADLFEAPTVARMADQLCALIERVAADPEARISELAARHASPARAACRAIERALLEDPEVDDCAARVRPSHAGRAERVAYVVSSDPLTPAELSRRLAATLPAAARPEVIVPLAFLPRTPEGRVDEEALAAVPVIDVDLARRWEARLRDVPGVGDVAVVAGPRRNPAPRLHLGRLLPGAPTGEAPAMDTPAVDAPAASDAPRRALAFSDGGPLHIPEGAPATLAEALLRAASGPKGIRYVQPDGSTVFQSYAALLEEARALLAGLSRAGLGPGDRLLLQIDAQREALAAFWACVLGGIAPVIVAVPPSYEAPSGVLSKLRGAWHKLGRPRVLTARSLAASLRGAAASLGMEGLDVLPIEDLRGDPGEARLHAIQPDDTAFLQLSSGSTGAPKCIRETHRAILLHAHAAARHNGYVADDVTLCWIPLDHVMALITFHLKDVCLGCDQIWARAEQILASPLRWLDLIERHQVTQTGAPNFGLKLLCDAIAGAPGRSWDLSSLRRFLNGGEQVTLGAIRELLRLAAPFGLRPEVMQPAFGMAEACTGVAYQDRFDLDRGARHVVKASLGGALAFRDAQDGSTVTFMDLGPPVAGVQIRIVDAENRILPEGVIGRLQLRGGVITPGYLDDPEANQAAFVGDGWFNTGDLGFLLEGRLLVTGREKEVIVVRGVNLHCHEIEDVAGGVPGVEPTLVAACAVAELGGAEELAVFFVPRDPAAAAAARIAEAVRAAVTARLGVAPAQVIPLERSDFPRTTSGKVQREALRKALAEGRFRRAVESVDLELGNERTLPGWFFRPAWRERPARTGPRRPGACLILADAGGAGERLRERLTRAGRACVVVTQGPELARVGPRSYRVDPAAPDQMRRLLDAAQAESGPLDDLVHLWTLGDDPEGGARLDDRLDALQRALAHGALSVLHLAQALAGGASAGRPVRLLIASSRAQAVSPGDALDLEKAPLCALVQTLPRELPWIDCRHVDLPAAEPAEGAARRLADELAAGPREREVAYRGGERFVLGLEAVDPARSPPRPPAFTEGGAYLISGGLGGVGVVVARHLIERFRARLLLVGRTPPAALPPARAEALAALRRAAERHGGDVIYEAADVADAGRLRAIAAPAAARWGRALDGAIHLAVSSANRRLVEETGESFAAALRGKGLGFAALAALLEGRPDRLLLGFSSVNAYFGGHSAGAYAAANRMVEHAARELRRGGMSGARTLAWSLWEELGMSRGGVTLGAARARGYLPIPPAQALRSLEVALCRDEPHLLVGLDAQSRAVARHAEGDDPGLQRLTAYVTSTAPEIRLPDGAAERDRFGVPIPCRVARVERIPRAPDGRVEVEALEEGSEGPAVRPPHVTPRDEAEQRVASVWRDVLQADRVGALDNFFDLGGHSLLVAQVQGRLEACFGRPVSAVEIFRYPTVRALAEHLSGAEGATPARGDVEERARKQRDANNRHRQAAQGARAARQRG
ncbi:amino acid adenylation domain-containing protein [Sorangium sp. So ce375]|uniref:amino acid adenylation domain-containing protein n=1 Tax=Sorangium sp. So ce375 TaxID=3133306 RepID=UPI003F5B60F0